MPSYAKDNNIEKRIEPAQGKFIAQNEFPAKHPLRLCCVDKK
jgi:hypothetical protein